MNISLNKDTHLSSFSAINTDVEKIYSIEYFPEKYVSLKLLSTSSNNLENSLNELSDGNPISVDFEWKPDITTSFHPISIFQFCTSKGVIVVENDDILLSKIDDSSNDNNNDNDNDTDNDGKSEKDISNINNYNALKNFLMSNKFFGKGTTTDKLKLKMMFDYDFDIEDIEITYLKPNDLPLGFSTLVQRLIGRPSAHFKDPKVSRSDWSKRPLSVLQLLYAGFDAYSMHLCYNKIIKLKPEELKTIFLEKNSLFTKKHKLKSELAQKQSLNLKIKFFVSYNNNLKNSGSLRNQEVDPMKFVEHEEYSTKFSLFYMFLALRKIQILNDPNKSNSKANNNENTNNNDTTNESNHDDGNLDNIPYRCILCDIILPTKKATIDHLWSHHYSDIPSIYFLWQSPAYLSGCIKQIAFASQNLVTEDDHIKCAICGKKLQKFRNLYTHFRIYHMNSHPSDQINNPKNESESAIEDVTESINPKTLTPEDYTSVDYPDLKEILYDHLDKTGKISKKSKTCHICENFLRDQIHTSEISPYSISSVKISEPKVTFETDTEFSEHCWNNHPGIFISLWKHRPSPYPKDLFEKCNKFGVVAIEKMLCGTMYNGVYACSFCLVGFDSPGELFIHLIHRHTVIQAVPAAEIDDWPIKIREMPAILQNMIRKMNFNEILAVLENENVIKIDRNVKIEEKKDERKKSKKASLKEERQAKESGDENLNSQQKNSKRRQRKQNSQQQNEKHSNSEQQNEAKSNQDQKQDETHSNSKQQQNEAKSNQDQKQEDAKLNSQHQKDDEAQSNSEQNQQQEIPPNLDQKQQISHQQDEKQLNSHHQKENELNSNQTDSQQSHKEAQSNLNPDQKETKKAKKQRIQNPNKRNNKNNSNNDDDDNDDKGNENDELEFHPFFCNECKVSLTNADERWNHLLEKHLIIDFSGVRYRCHDDLPFLSEE